MYLDDYKLDAKIVTMEDGEVLEMKVTVRELDQMVSWQEQGKIRILLPEYYKKEEVT
jgi:hypothetical protein